MKEKNPIDSKFIDSSIWLAYVLEGKHKDIIESSELLLISVLSLFEIHKKLLKVNASKELINSFLSFIKKKSIIINVDEKIVEKAVFFSYENNLPVIDSLIYASSIENESSLFTSDNDFRGLKNVVTL